MTRIQSFDIETDAPPGAGAGKARNPYGPKGGGPNSGNSNICLSPNTARAYFMFAIALFVFYGIGKMLYATDTPNSAYDEWKKSKGDASGGWGIKHNHPVKSNYVDRMSANRIPPPSQSSSSSSSSSTSSSSSLGKVTNAIDSAEHELWESDLLQLISPIITIPSHPLHEYQKYQTYRPSGSSTTSTDVVVEMLYDKSTPHGKAFDFLLNRDTRPHQDDSSVMLLEDDMQYLVQRFVVTLLFYATGGRDTTTHNETNTSKIMEAGKEVGSENDGAGIMTKSIRSGGGGGGGWESSTAHFLTGLHECHWVKKSLEDQLWSMLSIDKDKDRRVGVTKCNANMEVTEICLGAYIHQSGLNIEHTNNGTDTRSLTCSCVNTVCITFQ